MTAITPHRNADKATSSSPAPSRKSSTDDGGSQSSRPTSGQGIHDHANGAAPHSEHSHKFAHEKQSMTKRLTRMFSTRDATKSSIETNGTKSPPKATTPVPGQPSTTPTV